MKIPLPKSRIGIGILIFVFVLMSFGGSFLWTNVIFPAPKPTLQIIILHEPSPTARVSPLPVVPSRTPTAEPSQKIDALSRVSWPQSTDSGMSNLDFRYISADPKCGEKGIGQSLGGFRACEKPGGSLVIVEVLSSQTMTLTISTSKSNWVRYEFDKEDQPLEFRSSQVGRFQFRDGAILVHRDYTRWRIALPPP